MANARFLDSRMPTILDLPMIDTVIVEVPNPGHPFDVRGEVTPEGLRQRVGDASEGHVIPALRGGRYAGTGGWSSARGPHPGAPARHGLPLFLRPLGTHRER